MLFLIAKLRSNPVNKRTVTNWGHTTRICLYCPFVTMVIAAYNEENTVKEKLENSLSLDYPKDRFEIIVVSDGSTDQTNKNVEEFADLGVKLIKLSKRSGKAHALNTAVSEANGEIILFSDARQLYDKDAVCELVANFNDEEVGGVSGELHLISQSGTGVGKEVGLYWRYEKFLRKTESRVSSTLGATGAIYAIRRRLFSPIPEDTILDDVVIPMRIVLNGYRVVFEPKAHAYDNTAATSKEEFTRKARTLAGNYQAFFRMKELFNPFKNRVFCQLISHKVFRLLVPFALFFAFLSNAFFTSPLYRTTLFLQATLYACATIGFLLSKFKTEKTQDTEQIARIKSFLRFLGSLFVRLFSTSYVFVLLNWAAVVGLYRFITGKQRITWKKAVG